MNDQPALGTPPNKLLPIIHVSLSPRIDLDHVYQNGLHALCRFYIQNTSPDKTLAVKLRSNLANHVSFQLTNENFPDASYQLPQERTLVAPPVTPSLASSFSGDSFHLGRAHPLTVSTTLPDDQSSSLTSPCSATSPTGSIVDHHIPDLVTDLAFRPQNLNHSLVTNTVAAAQLGAYATGGPALEFNQLFNYVNHIDLVTLQPCETRMLILAFLPTVGLDSLDDSGAIQGTPHPPESILDQSPAAAFTVSDVESSTYDFHELTGALMFSAYQVPTPTDDLDSTSALKDPAAFSSKPDFNLIVKFKARMCKSVLWSEVTHSGLLFDDCVLDGTFIRDFTVWNKSEIDLYWTLNTAAVSHSLTFTDYNTGEPLDTSQPIPSYSHCRVRVTYRPKQVGDFSYEIQLENVNDDTNIEVVCIHCMVRSALQDDLLLVLSGQHLDFGDVTAGIWNKATLVLKNISEHDMDIKFVVEGANGRVVFHVPQPELNPVYEPVGLGLEGATDEFESSNLPWLATIKSRGSSNTSSPVSTRSVSMDLSLNDLVGRSPLGARTIVAGPYHSSDFPTMADHGSFPNFAALGIRGGKQVPKLPPSKEDEEESSDSESLVSTTPSLRSNGSHVVNNHTPSASSITNTPSLPPPTFCVTNGQINSVSPRDPRTRPRTISPYTISSPDTNNLAPLALDNTAASPHVEEIVLKPGIECSVVVTYLPERAQLSDVNATHLVKSMFRVVLCHAKNRKVIQCKMRTCTSYVTVSPSIVSFGDTDVGMLKSAPVRITNMSEIPARVELVFASKVLSCMRDEIHIPPKQSVEVKIDIYPRKVNPDYRKQITVLNLLNRSNDQIVEVQSTNIDKQKITWHGFFYRIMTPSSANYIDFGGVVGTYQALRTFSVQNVSKSDIVLSIKTSADNISLFLVREAGASKVPNLAAQKLALGTMADRKTIKRTSSDLLVTPTSTSAAAYLDLAVSRKYAPAKHIASEAEAGTPPTNSITDVVHLLQNLNIINLPRFLPAAEQKFVKLIMALRKSLEAVIQNGELMPITNIPLTLTPGSEIQCVAVFQAPSSTNRRKKLDTRLLFNLSEFDPTLLPTTLTSLPVRELLVRCIVCPSELEVGQRNINFGTIELQASMSKTIFVRNKSDAPLLYVIKKSGSIASGDVTLENQSGAVPPHGAREVTFTFQPTMPGLFFEKLIVENVLNPQTSQVISLKANVRKPESFSIHTESLDFGVCMVNELSVYRILTLHNTHRHVRTFTIRAGDETEEVEFEFAVMGSTTMEYNTREVEDKIEALEQKLKIATRKGQQEKVDKITDMISKLRRDMGTSDDGRLEVSVQDAGPVSKVGGGVESSPMAHSAERKIGALTLPVEPFAIMKIGVAIRAKVLAYQTDCPSPSSSSVALNGFIYIHHHKNTDLIKKVAYMATICYDQPSFIESLDHAIHVISAGPGGSGSDLGNSCVPRNLVSMHDQNAVSPALKSSSAMQGYVLSTNTATFVSSPCVDPIEACAFLENSVVDVGKFQIGHEAAFYFVLINVGTVSAPYYTHDPSVSPTDRNGVLSPGERRVINATIVPTASGRQSYSIGVWCQGLPQIFTLNFTAVYKDGLVFTETAPASSHSEPSPQIQEIDLGFCYNAKRFAPRATIYVTNTMPESILMSAASTLSQQVGVFSDSDCLNSLADVALRPFESTVAYVAVQPNLAQAPLLGIGKLATFESRQLVGGVKFVSTAQSTGVEVCAQHLRFQAIIGPSLFTVSSTLINLGTVYQVSDIDTTFTVFNLSDRMPLHYSVTCSDPLLVTIHTYPSTLCGTSPSVNCTIESSSQTTIKLSIHPQRYGHFCETVCVTNLNCLEQSTSICITALVDPQELGLSIPELPPSSVDVQVACPLPILQWDHIYVYQPKSMPDNSFATCVDGLAKTVTITNNSLGLIRILPFADLNLNVLISNTPPPSLLIEDAPNDVSVMLFRGQANPCGPIMVAEPDTVWSCSVSAPLPPGQLSEEDVQSLHKGRNVKIRGFLAFAKCPGSCNHLNDHAGYQVTKVIELVACYAISRVEVVPLILPKGANSSHGKYAQIQVRRGEFSQFSVTVKNVCSSPTTLQISSSSAAVVCGAPNMMDLEPFASKEIEMAVSTNGLESGVHECMLRILNLHNPSNELDVPVSILVTSLDLTLDGRGDLDASNSIVLPAIHIPNFAGTLNDAWFTLINPTSSEVRFTVEALLIQSLSPFMSMHLLNRFSNSPLNWLELHAGGSVEIKVKVVVKESAKLTLETCPEWVLDPRGIQIGQLIAENEMGKLVMPVRSQIVEQPCFEMGVASLNLNQGGEPSLIPLTNLSSHHPVTLGLMLEPSQDFGERQVQFPSQVNVLPGATVNVPIQLLQCDLSATGDVFTLRLVDSGSVQKQHRLLRLRCVEVGLIPSSLAPMSSMSVVEDGSESDTLPATSGETTLTDFIIIKGCPKRGRLYEVDLGQQDLGAGTITRKITLELQKPAKSSYRIRTTPPDCSEWLSLSRSEGTLDNIAAGGSKHQSVVLSFSTSVRNVFSTYLVVENLNYAADVKYVKVSLEVVARVNARKARAFDVVCDLRNKVPRIVFENVYYGQEYASRSFTIVNNEVIPLEFTLKLLNLDVSDPTEVLFSTSKSIAKLFKTVVVPAESSIRVYVRLRPMRNPNMQRSRQASQLDVSTFEISDQLGPAGSVISESEATQVKEFDIIVNCRLVRDYQQVIHVKATCLEPQMRVSAHDIVISAVMPSDGGPLICADPVYDLVVSNLSVDQPLHLHVIQPVEPFTVDIGTKNGGAEYTISPGGQHILRISLDVDEASRQLDILRRERYAQAYAVVYNRDAVFEHVFVTIRLSLGHLDVFSLVWWTSRGSATFAAVEAAVIEFLRVGAWGEPAAFQYRVIIDQLVYLTVISTPSDHVFHLAALLFSNLVPGNRDVVWVGDGLRYYLGFFTMPHPLLEALGRMYELMVGAQNKET